MLVVLQSGGNRIVIVYSSLIESELEIDKLLGNIVKGEIEDGSEEREIDRPADTSRTEQALI